MSSTLIEQLQRLAVPQTATLCRTDKKRASILFDVKEAANISKETIYQIAIDGLEELKAKNPIFHQFEATLFHATAKQFERSVQTVESNDKLNTTIHNFFHQLLPYFLTNAAHKVLEWLVFRYQIHDYNKDGLIMLILPYHDTNIFVRVLQIIEIKENDKWLWLKPLQKPGIHLAKNILYNHVGSNAGFVQLISDNLLAAIKLHEKPSNLTVYYNFYCATFTGAIVHGSVIGEPVIVQMMPSIVKGLKSEIPDFCASAYVILSKLLTKAVLTDKVLDLLLEKITEFNVPMMRTEGLLVLIILYQSHENYKRMPQAAIKNLAKCDWLPRQLRELAENGCVINTLLLPIFSSALRIAMNEVSTTYGKELVDSLVNPLQLSDILVHEIFEVLTLAYNFKSSYLPETSEWMKTLVQTLERQYPEAYDKEVSRLMTKSSASTANQRKAFQRILQNGNFYNQVELFEKLYHPQADIRKAATKSLLRQYDNLNEREQGFIKSVFIDRVNDEDEQVVRDTILSADKILSDIMNNAEFQRTLIRLMYKHKFTTLSHVLIKKLLETENVLESYEVLITLIPYLIPEKHMYLKNATFLIEKYCAESPLLRDFYKAISPRKEGTFTEIADIVLENLSKIALNTQDLVNVYKGSENTEDPMYKYMFALLLSKAQCTYEPIAMELLIEFYHEAKTKCVKDQQQEEIASLSTSHQYLPVEGYLSCIARYIQKSPKLKLHNFDFSSSNETKTQILLINFLLSGVFHAKSTYAKVFAKTFKIFLEHYAQNAEIMFLLNIAAADNALIIPANKLRSLRSVKELLTASKHTSLENDKLIVPYLLSCLFDKHELIRINAVDCLKIISKLRQSEYCNLIRGVLNGRVEIAIDAFQLPIVIYNCKDKSFDGINSLVKLLREDVPIYLKSNIILALGQLNQAEIYQQCVEFALNIFETKNVQRTKIVRMCIEQFTPDYAAITQKNSSIWKFIEATLKDDIVEVLGKENEAPAILLMNKIDREMYNRFDGEMQVELLNRIIEMSTNSSNPELLPCATKIFKHIDLDAKTILKHLVGMRDVVSPKLQTKLRRRINVVPTIDILDLDEWKKGLTVLEFIQEKKKLRSIPDLIPVLFDILKKCLDFDEQANVEYPKQLVLSSILHYCDKIDPRELPQTVFNMELVVQCIRASQNPQTHHHALLLLAKVATFIPSQVLLHIMTIFTFMGSSVLRHDDAYSFQIISKIIETIIPILVQEKAKENIVNVLRVFVDVILDVPEHRRLPLYGKLLEQIGPKENIYIFLVLICEAHVLKKTNKDGTTRLDIARNLCLQFTPEVVLNASIQLIDYVKILPVDKENYQTGQFIFDIKNNTPKQFRHYKYSLILFISNLLSSKEFVNEVAKLSDEEHQQLEDVHKKMIVSVLTYIQSSSKIADLNVNTPQAQYWKVMLHHTYDILDSLNALLTSQMFLLVVKGLMTHQLGTVKRRTLELLNNKLQHNPDFFDDCEKADLFAMIPPIIVIIKEVEKDDLDSEDEVIIQTALLSLKLFVRLLAAENQVKFVQILNFITELIKTKIDPNIMASAILCLAELCTQLRSHSISAVNKYMPAVIKMLKSQTKEDTPTLLLLSIVTALQKILDVLALFLSPYLENMLFAVCNITSKWSAGSDPKLSTFLTKMDSIKEKLGNLPSRVLIPAVGATFKKLLEKGHQRAIKALMDILSEGLTHLKGQELQQNLPELTTFFLDALEYRVASENEENTTLVEGEVINALTNLVLKLSETSFRPLYYKLYDWAIRSSDKSHKTITFYSVSHKIATSLKGLFVLFAGHFIANAATLLDALNVNKKESLYFPEEAANIELLENVLKTMNMVCMHDSQKFINKERFDVLMQPIVDQLDNTLGAFEERVREIVIPTVVNFTVATADDALWKQLNYQILLKTRDSNPKIRMLALECLKEVCKKVGEDFLPLLPETIPFLAELLEDEEEDIEKACQKTIQELEKVLGEPLQKYF